MTKKETPSAEQLAALAKFAKANGRTWKSKLHEVWMNGHYRSLPGTDEYWFLQQLRNQFGPRWLQSVKLAAPAEPEPPQVLTKTSAECIYWTPEPVLRTGERNEQGHRLADLLGREVQWSKHDRVPEIGETVNIRCNGIGLAVVKGYFVEHGFAGVLARPINPPEWYRKQNVKPTKILGYSCGVFGSEFDLEPRRQSLDELIRPEDIVLPDGWAEEHERRKGIA